MLSVAFSLLVVLFSGTPANPVTPALASLEGTWTVDLRPTAEAVAHPMPMTIRIAPDGILTGTFYNGPIDLGRAVDSKGRRCFAFTTADHSGFYHTSGCLTDDKTIEGQTWSEGRNFLLPWTATKTTQTK